MSARTRRTERRDDGAALVEFAFVALPLFLLLFGVIEFGWAFYQTNEVRHGAREGIRLVAVNEDPTPAEGTPADQGERLAQETCERMDRHDGVRIEITLSDRDGNNVFDTGDDATVRVTKDLDQLTSMFDPFLGSVVLDETVTTRLEQDPGVDIDGTDYLCA